jgi:hypothetical protein
MTKELEIKRCVDQDIRKLLRVFRRQPAMFFTEADVQSYLYSLLINDRALREFQPPVKGYDLKTVLVHAEARTTRPKQRRFDIVVGKPVATLDENGYDGLVGIEIKFDTTYSSSGNCNISEDIRKAHGFDVGYVLWLNWRFRISKDRVNRAEAFAKKYGNVTFWFIDMSTKPIATNVPRV